MQLFYTTEILDETAHFPEEESRHITQSLRKRSGAVLKFTDGRGGLYEGILEESGRRTCTARIITREQSPHASPELTLAIAPTKQHERMEWLVEKAVEMGVGRILPLRTQHGERPVVRHDRLQRVALSAMKQSMRCYLPEIAPLQDLRTLADTGFEGFGGIAWCGEGARTELADCLPPGSPACILIGPEGDFSPEEVRRCTAAGFREISLGKARLRTETAALYAVAVYKLINRL